MPTLVKFSEFAAWAMKEVSDLLLEAILLELSHLSPHHLRTLALFKLVLKVLLPLLANFRLLFIPQALSC